MLLLSLELFFKTVGFFYPIKYYCTNSIIEELEKFVQRQNFASNCELWRKREVGEHILADVYDGKL